MTPAQRAAHAHVREQARQTLERARIALRDHGIAQADIEGWLRDHGRITLNFHPDRLLSDGRSVSAHLRDEARYKGQFETGISSGSRSAFPGGQRDVWEQRLFGGSYHGPGAAAHERPKYGVLDLMHHADGGSVRFGSCYVELRAHMLERCTFSWGDSHQQPQQLGTHDTLEPVWAALFAELTTGGDVLASRVANVQELIARLRSQEHRARRDPARRSIGRALDSYIEAQVHASIDFACDVAAIVVDPSYAGSATEADLEALAEQHNLALLRHAGFDLDPVDIPDDFRGARVAELGRRVAEVYADGTLDAAAIGRAAASLEREPTRWQDWADYATTWQQLKQLWHCVAQYGRPRSASHGSSLHQDA